MATQQVFLGGHVIAFIGGGNMAGAMVGGLHRRGLPSQQVMVIEPNAQARARLETDFGIHALAQPDDSLLRAGIVVWAVKPQILKAVALSTKPFLSSTALHISIAAGVRSDSLQSWLASQVVVRAMPNTPALIGQGISGVYASGQVSESQKNWAQEVLGALGQSIWVDQETLIDAVTAVSGSGPAYVYYFAESMVNAGVQLGLTPGQAKELALATFAGATELARTSPENLSTLREQVTSKGGTTYAALSAMQSDLVGQAIGRAVQAAAARAKELGEQLGS